MTTVTTAHRTALLPRDTRAAFAVDGAVTTFHTRGSHLELEATALLRALSGLRAHPEVAYQLTGDLVRSLSDPTTVPVRNLARFLEKLGTAAELTAVVSDPDPTLLAHLAGEPLEDLGWELEPSDAAWATENGATVVYTDGAHDQGTLYGSWGWYVDDATHSSGVLEHVTTSRTAERRALAEALLALPGPLLVLSDLMEVEHGHDSLLVAMGVDDHLPAQLEGRTVRVSHVKGHARCRGNLAADHLAGTALGHHLATVTPEALAAHRLEAARANELMAPRREYLSNREAWCSIRRKELIAELYPHWSSMSKAERHAPGRGVQARATLEYEEGRRAGLFGDALAALDLDEVLAA